MRAFDLARWVAFAALLLVLVVPAAGLSVGNRLLVEVDPSISIAGYAIGDAAVARPATASDLTPGRVVAVTTASREVALRQIEWVQSSGRIRLEQAPLAAEEMRVVNPGRIVGVLEFHLRQPSAGWLLQSQKWPMRICVVVVIIGLALMPLGKAYRSTRIGARRRPREPLNKVTDALPHTLSMVRDECGQPVITILIDVALALEHVHRQHRPK